MESASEELLEPVEPPAALFDVTEAASDASSDSDSVVVVEIADDASELLDELPEFETIELDADDLLRRLGDAFFFPFLDGGDFDPAFFGKSSE